MLNIPIKDYFRETRLFNSRLFIAVIIALIMVALVLTRLIYLQVISHKHYTTLSQANRINPLPIPPVRGLVLDRNGVVLAQNFPVFTLEIIPDQVQDMNELLRKLSELVSVNEKDLKHFHKLLRTRPRFESLALRTHLTDAEAGRIAVNRAHLNGVELYARLQRHYPQGPLGVHAIGYVGRINEAEAEKIDKSAYRGTQHIGKLGVELMYEDTLLGRVGVEKVETNAHGRALRTLERIPPVAGKNIYLNLDARLQAIAEQALGERKGAVIATDPRNGAVLVFMSTPTYDPNPFVNGINTDSYRKLLENPNKPLINRALNGQYAPGSTIKPFLGLAALEHDGFDPNRHIICPGWFTLPGSRHVFRDWKKGGHGSVDLHDAIVQSCDVYFYKLAVELDIDGISKHLKRFGFGSKTGIDLFAESEGLVPSRAWKKARGQIWYPGETVISGIGQGPMLVTPLQLASATAALANNGVRLKPRLLMATEDPKTKVRRENIPQRSTDVYIKDRKHLTELIRNMMDVVHTNKGTAQRIGYNAPYKIAGKTGTAQVKGIAQTESYDEKTTPEHLRDHALFIAFAPAEAPTIAVAVIVENGGHGSSAAAPIARRIMDAYLLSKEDTAKADARPAQDYRG